MGFPLHLSTCAASAIELHLLADGELDDADSVADVRGHIAGCADCLQTWRGLTSTRQLLVAAYPHAAVPADVLACLFAVTNDE